MGKEGGRGFSGVVGRSGLRVVGMFRGGQGAREGSQILCELGEFTVGVVPLDRCRFEVEEDQWCWK